MPAHPQQPQATRNQAPRECRFIVKSAEEAVQKDASVATTIEMKIHGEEEFFRIEAMAVEGPVSSDTSESEVQVIVFLTELTDYRNRELELRKMEAALEQNPSSVFMTTPDGTFHYVNPRFETLYGYLWEDLKGKTPAILQSGSHSKKFYRQMWSTLEQGNIWKGEVINQRCDGTKVVVQATIFPIYGHQGEIVYYIAVQEDITARKKASEELQLFSGFAESVNFSVVFSNPQREVIWVNPAFENLTGYKLSEVLGKNLKNILQGKETDTATQEAMHEAMEAGKAFEGDIVNYSKAGKAYWVHLQIEPIYNDRGKLTHFVSIQNDVTDKVIMERKINQKQRMESIGSLAGGLAHDINNLLQPISLGIDQLKSQEAGAFGDSTEILDLMQESVTKAAGTIRQVLTFARGGDQKHEVVDILPILEQTNRLARETVPRKIQIDFQADSRASYVRIAPTQMTQVLMNLILNARDAIEEKGWIRLRLHHGQPAFSDSSTVLGKIPDNESVWIEVSDNGCGIPAKDQVEIFEPFYSTKSQDKGTGMGLATTYGIVKNLNGCLVVDSDGKTGSSFYVGMELSKAPEVKPPVESPAAPRPEDNSDSSSLIMIVDDEKAIGRSLGTVFQSQGYGVEVFDSSVRALKWLLDGKKDVKLLVVDYMMPELDGTELVAKAREQYPELPVILMTGVQDSKADQRFAEAGIQNILNKPFDVNKLLERVRVVLNA